MRAALQKKRLLWTRGVAARETLRYLDKKGINAEPALLGAGLSRHQLLRSNISLSVASQYQFLELAAVEAGDQLLGLHVAVEMDLRSIGNSVLPYRVGANGFRSARKLGALQQNLK